MSALGSWPMGGYAPGRYMCICYKCEKRFEGDKRAIECLPCAFTAAGYRILGPGELDGETVEACAAKSDTLAITGLSDGRKLASILRSLKGKADGKAD